MQIILVGYMCAGKSTVVKALSSALNKSFYDLDRYIENRLMKTIAQVFNENGEVFFRETERNLLHEVAEFNNIVLSCGGGTPCFYDNMNYMNSIAETVYIKYSAETLSKRISNGRTNRPLIQHLKNTDSLLPFVEKQLKEREKYYLQAKHIIDGETSNGEKNLKEIINNILESVNKK